MTDEQWPDPNRTVIDVIDFFEQEVETALQEHRRPKGGMSVPFHGDFRLVPVSALIRMQWWIREMRAAWHREENK